MVIIIFNNLQITRNIFTEYFVGLFIGGVYGLETYMSGKKKKGYSYQCKYTEKEIEAWNTW